MSAGVADGAAPEEAAPPGIEIAIAGVSGATVLAGFVASSGRGDAIEDHIRSLPDRADVDNSLLLKQYQAFSSRGYLIIGG